MTIELKTTWEWSCGHHAIAMCGECYRIVADAARVTAEDHIEQRERIACAAAFLDALADRFDATLGWTDAADCRTMACKLRGET